MHFHTLLFVLAALFVIGTSASPAQLANETDVRLAYDQAHTALFPDSIT